MELKLYEHQKMMLALLRLNDSFAIFAEQGTGKTLPVLIRLGELIEEGWGDNCLVVCPKAVIGSWYRDMEKFYPGVSDKLRKHITVTSYDLVWRRKEFRRHWDAIVLDESHKIKNHSAKRSQCLLEMALDSDYRYILTGTPISNGMLEDIWSQYTFLEPYKGARSVYSRIFGGSYYQFLNAYALLNKYHRPYRYIHVDALQDIINEHSFRVKKADCLDLPDKLPDEIYDIDLLEKKAYKELHEESALEDLDVLASNPLSRMTKLRQMCSGWVNDGHEDIPMKCEKLAALADFLDGWEKKLVIFCEFRRSIDNVVGLLQKEKINYVVLDGRTKDKTVWKKFQEDPTVQIIVCQYQSANAGIDLYAADTMLFYEPTLSSNVLEQAKDRIHRIGQKSPCSYIHFLTKGTIEKAIYRALTRYADFSDKLFREYMLEWQKGFKE